MDVDLCIGCMDDDLTISQRLKTARENLDIPQQAVADVLNISQSAYSRRETGIHNFTAGEAVKVARFIKADVRKIFE